MSLKRISVLLTISCSFIGCTQTPPISKAISPHPIQPTTFSPQSSLLPPASYQAWLLQSGHQFKSASRPWRNAERHLSLHPCGLAYE